MALPGARTRNTTVRRLVRVVAALQRGRCALASLAKKERAWRSTRSSAISAPCAMTACGSVTGRPARPGRIR